MLALNVRHSPRGIGAVSSIYLMVFMVFHLALVLCYAVGLVELSSDFDERIWMWFETPATCSARGAGGDRRGRAGGRQNAGHFMRIASDGSYEMRRRTRPALGNAGAILLLASCVAWFYIIVILAQIDLLGGYEAFYTGIGDFDITYIECLISLGLVVTLLGPGGSMKMAALLAVCVWAVAVLLLGHRGAILFPVAGAAASLGLQRRLLSPFKALIAAVILLGLIAAIRELRRTGVREADDLAVSVSPVDGLMELGSSLRPVREAFLWIQQGDEYSRGASFWAPFDRALYHVIPGWSRPAAELDERLLKNIVEQRAGAIGFSNLAESYYNLGPWGVLLEFMAIGFLFGKMDFWPARAHLQTIAGVCLIPLLVHVRNTFTPVPAQVIVGLGNLLAAATITIAPIEAHSCGMVTGC